MCPDVVALLKQYEFIHASDIRQMGNSKALCAVLWSTRLLFCHRYVNRVLVSRINLIDEEVIADIS